MAVKSQESTNSLGQGPNGNLSMYCLKKNLLRQDTPKTSHLYGTRSRSQAITLSQDSSTKEDGNQTLGSDHL